MMYIQRDPRGMSMALKIEKKTLTVKIWITKHSRKKLFLETERRFEALQF